MTMPPVRRGRGVGQYNFPTRCTVLTDMYHQKFERERERNAGNE